MKASETKRNLPQLQRAKKEDLPPFKATARDIAILEFVYKCRALTAPQIERMFFPPQKGRTSQSTSSRCQHRLKALYHHGFLERTEQPQLLSQGRKPFVYWLDKRGVELLAQIYDCEPVELAWDPVEHKVKYLFLEHLLGTNDVRIAITLAAKQQGFAIEQWLDEKTLKSKQMKDVVILTDPQGKRKQRAAVVPDGYFVLHTGSHRYHQFIEIDMGTVTGEAVSWERRDWGRKIAAFLQYHRSGQYQERYGTQGMRVLTITTSAKRLNHLKEITEKVGGKSRFWFTIFDRITPEWVLTKPIWQVAGREGLHSLTW